MHTQLQEICALLRTYIVKSTTAAASGHPTSSLSAVELMATLFFGGYFRYDLRQPDLPQNDRLIFSKGHASPLFYALYAAAGAFPADDLLKLRRRDSTLEGHPTPEFPFTEAATGSLGQGLSVGLGIALAQVMQASAPQGQNSTTQQSQPPNLPRVYVLLGDSEIAEGQIWEAAELAAHYQVRNLIAILDANRLGQCGETMYGWDISAYQKQFSAFGWNTIIIEDGHALGEITKAFDAVTGNDEQHIYTLDLQKPTIIIARTKKGKGISFLENKEKWHGKPVPQEMLDQALREIGTVNWGQTTALATPAAPSSKNTAQSLTPASKQTQEIRDRIATGLKSVSTITASFDPASGAVATRQAYGEAIVSLGTSNKQIVALDAETSNSTYADKFKAAFPERFREMYIAEQNMVSVAVGMARMGYIPFVSSFAAFLTRAFDQIRMAQYSNANIKIIGSHAGVSIGQDGASQMALEDLSMMQSILNAVVLYPSDAVSTVKLTEQLALQKGISYLRTTREKTPILYTESDTFTIGGSRVLKESEKDSAVIFAAGITLHESLKAYEALEKHGIHVAIVDLYSIKPIDAATVTRLAQKTGKVLVVEDHYPYGGIGAAVQAALLSNASPTARPIHVEHLCVRQIPHSGMPEELLSDAGIDAAAIVEAIIKGT